MNLKTFSKACILAGISALFLNCSGSSSGGSSPAPLSPPNNSQNSCQSFAVPCMVSHGSGTQSCTDSSEGPVYGGTCSNVICDSGFHLNSDGICVGGESTKTFSMLVTGPSLSPQGVSSFIAQVGATYDFKISGSQDVVASGINASQSYAKYISGQCSGIGYKYQPLTTNFAPTGPTPQFGDNNVTYTPSIADVIGGCIWQVCAVSNDTTMAPACVNMIAAASALPVTTTTTLAAPTTTLSHPPTTLPAPTTTLPAPTTTLPHPPPTTLPAPTTTLPHPPPTTLPPPTTTTLPHPPPTTLPPTTTTTCPPPTTTTTTLPHEIPHITGDTCAGGGAGQYNCVSFAKGNGTGANNLRYDIGCTANVTITYRGQSISTSLFGNAAPYYSNGQGINTTAKTVPFQGVNFHIYVNDAYSLSEGLGWVSCSTLVSWPNFPNAPQ